MKSLEPEPTQQCLKASGIFILLYVTEVVSDHWTSYRSHMADRLNNSNSILVLLLSLSVLQLCIKKWDPQFLTLCFIILSKRTWCYLIDLFSCENQVSLPLMSFIVIDGRQPCLQSVSWHSNLTIRCCTDIKDGIASALGVCTVIHPPSATAGWPFCYGWRVLKLRYCSPVLVPETK